METIIQLNALASIPTAETHVFFSNYDQKWNCFFKCINPGEKIELTECHDSLSLAVGMIYQRVQDLSSQGMKSLTIPLLAYSFPVDAQPFVDDEMPSSATRPHGSKV